MYSVSAIHFYSLSVLGMNLFVCDFALYKGDHFCYVRSVYFVSCTVVLDAQSHNTSTDVLCGRQNVGERCFLLCIL